jgi:anti-sigma regulatory factor (Ser/Thr protein kinase)
VTPEARAHLPAVPESARVARRFVRELLAVWDCDDPDDIAVLLTSEVVSNVIRHAVDELGIDLRVDLADDSVRVEVRDPATTEPQLRSPDSGATSGRGLLLVDQLARRWGSIRDEAGKVVWFEVPANRRRHS